MALNNRAGINRETRRRVEETAARLGYAGVRRAAGRRIAVWMPQSTAPDEFQVLLLRGISLACAEAGFQTVYVATVPGRYGEPIPLPDPRDLDVEGMVVLAGPGQAHLPHLSAFPGGAVLLDTHRQHADCPSVDNDDEGGGYLGVRHLLALGHRTIAYIGGHGAHGTLAWRGARRALAEAGQVIRAEFVADAEWSVDAGFRAMTTMLERAATPFLPLPPHPTAVFCGADILAYGAIHALREHDLRVPEDVAVVAMDDIEMSAHFNPPLTTVRVPILEMGATAVRMLLGLLAGTWDSPQHIVLPNELVVRASCGAPDHLRHTPHALHVPHTQQVPQVTYPNHTAEVAQPA
jgi:LacI family transcriptional regulator